jgi:deoxyribonuclease-4
MRDLRLGGHLRTEDGLSITVATARGMCFNELQIMTVHGRDYEPFEVTEQDLLRWRKMSYEMTVTIHLPYTVNPCEDQPRRRQFYRHAVKRNIELGLALGARRFVLHPGFKKDLTTEKAAANLRAFLEESWSENTQATLLLETDSGSKNGSAVGSPEFIATTLGELELPNTGMCLDTEHLFARGTNLWDEVIRKDFLSEHGHLIRLVHLNCPDPAVSLGSFLDRHNTPFEERAELESEGLIEALSAYPMILERRSLQVMQRDNLFVRTVLGQPLEKQRA